MNQEIQKLTEYCLNCKNKPCSNKGCPLNNDIPTFIKFAKKGNIEEAYNTIIKTSALGGICGRICPHLKQCEGSCIRGIKGEPVQIGKIESYIFDEAFKQNLDKKIQKTHELKDKNIAIVGSGPASLNCAFFLAKKSANVTIFEKYNELGGILAHGIPSFRLEKSVLQRTIEQILNLGVKVEYNKELGKNLKLEELEKGYDAVFLGIGANVPSKMNIEGEDLTGVYGGNLLLEKNNHPNYEGKTVAIIGGGNVALDCARTINKMKAKKVYIIYRRAEEQMPAELKEIAAAKNEGIEFLLQNNITKIMGNSQVEKIECIKTELAYKEGETRLVPVNIENSNYYIDIDYVVMAIGSKPDTNIINKLNLELNKNGYIKVNGNYQTSNKKIFAGGDMIGAKQTVAWAAKTGREAAEAITNVI